MDLMRLLPEHLYNGEAHVQAMQDAAGRAAAELLEARDDLYKQMRQSTATWGLGLFEREYGILADEGKPREQRLSHLRAKRKGQGTTSLAMLKALSESFVGGEVEVLDYPEESRFEIKFVGQLGIPPNLNDLTAVIEEVKPAHLAFSYTVLYNTYNGLNRFTYGQLVGYSYQELREKRIRLNGHAFLKSFTFKQLSNYTHKQMNMEALQ